MDWERIAKAMGGALELIELVTERFKEVRAASGVSSAADALTIIGAITSAAKLPAGPVDPEAIEQSIERLRVALSENDATADRALKEKFKPET